MSRQKRSKWTRHSKNYSLSGNGFYISYNPHPGGEISMFRSDHDAAETALVWEEGTRTFFRILNGDWRKEYEAAVTAGWEACLAVYEQHKALHDSSWST
jgi:hypothetical protein